MATFVEFLSNLNSCKQQSVFWHNQTTSFSEHKTLNEFYEGIEDLLDGLVESVAGIYGRPAGYETHDMEDYVDNAQLIEYFKTVYDYIKTERASLYDDSWIQNQIDEIAALVASTLYKLTLK
jgi:DNA-binding ferritin-like protein